MTIRYDADEDAWYLRLDESEIVDSEDVHPGVILDVNEDTAVVGVEILRLRRRFPCADITDLRIDVA